MVAVPAAAFLCKRCARRQLLKNEVPILIEMCQPWVVLAMLASRDDEKEGILTNKFFELPYLQPLQLSTGNLRELPYLECSFGGAPARLALGLVSPVLPLAELLCCFGSAYFTGAQDGGSKLRLRDTCRVTFACPPIDQALVLQIARRSYMRTSQAPSMGLIYILRALGN